MIGPDHPKNGDRQRRPQEPQLFDWVDRLILLIVPKDRREEFVADLIQEWETEIRPKWGEELARRWIKGQVRQAEIEWLPRRLERVMWTAFGGAVGLLLFVYLLPGILVGLLLFGIGIVVRTLVDALGRPNPAGSRPPRGVDRFILILVVPRRFRDEFIEDLGAEYELKAAEIGEKEARRWLNDQVWRSITPWFLWRMARLAEFIRSGRFVGWGIRLAIIVYILPALVLIALVSLIGIVLESFMDTSGRPPWRYRLIGMRRLVRRILDRLRRFLQREIFDTVSGSYWVWG